MARLPKPLSHSQIANAKAKSKLYRLYDGDGLCLKIMSSGTKVWEYRFKNPETLKDDTYIIGGFPLLSLANARERHIELRKMVSAGINPKREDMSLCFSDVFADYYKMWSEGKAEKTKVEARGLVSTYAKRHIGHIPIDEIKPIHIVKVLDEVVKSKTLSLLPRIKSLMSRVFKYSVSRGYTEVDPTASISLKDFPSHTALNHRSLPPNEIYILNEFLKNGPATPQTLRAIEMVLRNIARAQEVVKMKWEYIDFENMIISLPIKVMKTRVTHVVPITKQVLKILEAQKNYTDYVFPSYHTGTGHMKYSTLTYALNRTNIGATAHGFRSLASTLLNEVGIVDGQDFRFDYSVIESLLAHKDKNAIRMTYNKAQYVEQKRIILQWWSDFIDKCDTKENNERALKEAGISLI